jgi:tyrosyl-tRNA synthetase
LTDVGLTKSNGEARRLIQGGGIRVNDEVIGDERAMLTPAMKNVEGVIKLSVGRKKHVLVKITG